MLRSATWFAVFLAILGAAWACVGDAPTSPPSVTCLSYCAKMAANCVTNSALGVDNSQYKSPDTCLAMCSHFAPGKLSDTSGNTLGCRMTVLSSTDDLRATDPNLHKECVAAGAYGCAGSTCEAFCRLDLDICNNTPQAPGAYASVADCLSACSGYAGADTPFPAPFVFATGDNLECRAYHLENAVLPGGAVVHCPHTGRTSAVCFDPPDSGSD